MKLSDLEMVTGVEFHETFDLNHLCKDDETPVYFLIDNEEWLTICQDIDNDDGLWRGEWDHGGLLFVDDYNGREAPEEVLEVLCAKMQVLIAEEILGEMEG